MPSHPVSCRRKCCVGLKDCTRFSAMITKTVKPELGGYSIRTYYPCFDSFSCPMSHMRVTTLCDVLNMQIHELCDFTRDTFRIYHRCCNTHKTVRATKLDGRGSNYITITGCSDIDRLICSYLENVQRIDNVACTCDKSPENQRADVERIISFNGKTRAYGDTSHDGRCSKVHASKIATFSPPPRAAASTAAASTAAASSSPHS